MFLTNELYYCNEHKLSSQNEPKYEHRWGRHLNQFLAPSLARSNHGYSWFCGAVSCPRAHLIFSPYNFLSDHPTASLCQCAQYSTNYLITATPFYMAFQSINSLDFDVSKTTFTALSWQVQVQPREYLTTEVTGATSVCSGNVLKFVPFMMAGIFCLTPSPPFSDSVWLFVYILTYFAYKNEFNFHRQPTMF